MLAWETGFGPWHPCKNRGMLEGVYNARDTKVDTDRSLGLASWPSKISGSRANEKVCFYKQGGLHLKTDTGGWLLPSTHTCMCTPLLPHAQKNQTWNFLKVWQSSPRLLSSNLLFMWPPNPIISNSWIPSPSFLLSFIQIVIFHLNCNKLT